MRILNKLQNVCKLLLLIVFVVSKLTKLQMTEIDGYIGQQIADIANINEFETIKSSLINHYNVINKTIAIQSDLRLF